MFALALAPLGAQPDPNKEELKLKLPKPMFIGTPTNLRSPNLEKITGKPRAPFYVPKGTVLLAMLPGMVLTGIGVGLTIPSLSSAAAASLPPDRFSTGIAVLTMSRQIGAVLGVAILVAILANPVPGDPVAVFQDAWIFMALASVAASLACLALGRVRVAEVGERPTANGAFPAEARA